MVRRRRSCDGFTVAELTVVIALMGVMLAVSYGVMMVVYRGQAASDRQAWFAREIGSPLEQLDQLFSQNTRLDAATTQTATFLVDRPRRVGSTLQFDNMEQHIIGPQLNASTGKYTIVDTVRGTDAMWNPTTVMRDISWGDDFGNVATGVPLFVFRDDDGAEVAPADAPTLATRVEITIVSARDGRTYRGSRSVVFRNR